MIRMDKMEEMLARFMDGQTTETEERQLADFFRKEEDIPEEWKSYQELFLSFETDAYAYSAQELDAMCADVESVDENETILLNSTHLGRKLKWGIAASVAILLGIGGVAVYNNISNGTGKPCVAQVTTSPTAIKKKTLVVDTVREKAVPQKVAAKVARLEKQKAPCGENVVGMTPTLVSANPAESCDEVVVEHDVENENLYMEEYMAFCSSPYADSFDIISSDVPEFSEKLISQNQ